MTQLTRAHLIGLAAVAVLASATFTGACSADVSTQARGRRISVTETSNQPTPRSVTIAATLEPVEGAAAVALRDVAIRVTPGDSSLVQKLEAVLSDVVLSDADGASWPRPITPLPAEAHPTLSRLQLALVMLGGAAVVDNATLALFEGAPTWGITRVTHRDGAIDVDVLGLTTRAEGPVFASGHLSGTRSGDAVSLRGTRRLGASTTEELTFSLEVSQATWEGT